MSENNKPFRTEVSRYGEFGLIEKLTAGFIASHPSTVKAVGDDAAVLRYPDRAIVVTSDLLIEGIHFDLAYTPLKHLGYKAASVNFSDVYAMNALPGQILVNIAISSRFSVEDLDEFYDGIKVCCNKHGVDLAGGDTSSSLTGMMISITAIGEVLPSGPVYRSTAQINDIICVSGDLGAAYMGLQLMEREKRVLAGNRFVMPDFEGNDYLLKRLLKPEARRDIVLMLKDAGVVPTAMIDISDGLSSELMHICSQSKKGCKIFEEKIPIAVPTRELAKELVVNPLVCALNGGEDYELLFTVPVGQYDKISSLDGITAIGHITPADAGLNLISAGGQFIPLQAQGWQAF